MANRIATHILKNSDIVNRPLPSTLLKGEAIVNTAEGIVFFSGVTTSTNNWTPAGTGTTANFFEVGSNLYDLQLRNRLTKYEGVSGGGLIGKFLSGTTNGFVLADISNIVGVDTYVTAFTYNNNVATIKQNIGQPDLSILINTMTGLTVNGSLSAITASATTFTSTDLYLNGDIKTYNGLSNLTGLFLSGTSNGFVLGAISAITGVDTYVTGFTYNPAQNELTISRNLGQPDLNVFITTVSGLTVSNLTASRLVYTTAGGKLTTGTAIFNGTDMTLPSAGSLSVGSGGITTTGDVIIDGSLTVLGSSISAFTSQLYVEDNDVFLNYNPTGSTIVSSIGAGWTIQDGNGVSGGSVDFDIRAMNGFTGLTSTQIPDITEYTGATGYSNRAWVTQLNDIVIRSTNVVTPNGVRVLAEFDILDGGTY
jgi:hypothetical protein